MSALRQISVIGLGYVGLPVAVAFGHHQLVIGFDINEERIKQLKSGLDNTQEVKRETLEVSQIKFTHDPNDLHHANFHIIAVPTPVDSAHKPDLSCLIAATELMGKYVKPGDIVVYESTVYPGTTEEICIPILEQKSKLKAGKDFFVGYSPERINPGDNQHSFTNIKKVVSGQDSQTTDTIAAVYELVVKAGTHKASSIKVAEAAKIIENTQRDLNIALMNELAKIFKLMEIDTTEVLDAASTKWNFANYQPGLVGGHCIGVDPYYLTYKAQQLGFRPEVILAGRRTNDTMGKYVAEQTIKNMIKLGCDPNQAKVAVLGITFKENCNDLRNSQVVNVIQELKEYGLTVMAHDPLVSKEDAKREYGITLSDWHAIDKVDAIILCVAHQYYLELTPQEYAQKLNTIKFIVDVKSKLDQQACQQLGLKVWRL